MRKNALFPLVVSLIKENAFVMAIVVTAALKKVFLLCVVYRSITGALIKGEGYVY